MKQNQPPHVQHEEFMKSLIGESLLGMPATTIIGDRVMIGSNKTPVGIIAVIEPDWAGSSGSAEALHVRIINKSCGILDSMYFPFVSFTLGIDGKKAKDEVIDDGGHVVELIMISDKIEWSGFIMNDKRIEPLRSAIRSYIAVWL
jgi:hypothetical protein